MADDFDRARMQMQDELLHDGRLSPASRLVGIEILRCVNRVYGYAWPGNGTVADRLGVTSRTVSTSVAELERAGYFRVARNVKGRTNRCTPRFVKERVEKFSTLPNQAVPAPPVTNVTRTGRDSAERVEKNATQPGKIPPTRVEKESTLSPSASPYSSPSRVREAAAVVLEETTAAKKRWRVNPDLKPRPGDCAVERRVSEQLGVDGDDVLLALHEVDDGAPYYRLIAEGRKGPLDARQVDATRAAYEAHLRPQSLAKGGQR